MRISFRKILTGFAGIIVIALSGIGYLAYANGYFASTAIYSTSNGAIDGYDPVAFHTMQKAVQGSAEIATEYHGAIWRFVSAENRAEFLANPQQYLPQYGGYCAYAMANGYTAYTDPTNWTIVDGRLFLNYDASVNSEWNNGRDAFIKQADQNWPNSQPGLDHAR